jgi:hypothetical protein
MIVVSPDTFLPYRIQNNSQWQRIWRKHSVYHSCNFYLWVLHPVAHLSNWFLMMPLIATKFQYVNSPFFIFLLIHYMLSGLQMFVKLFWEDWLTELCLHFLGIYKLSPFMMLYILNSDTRYLPVEVCLYHY